MPDGYISILSSLYTGQTAKVRTDRLSQRYSIGRGTKQGDPLSSLLFNALLEDIMLEVKHKWIKAGLGLQVGHSDLTQLTNLRFADDILLVSRSVFGIRRMLCDLIVAAKKRGLELHPKKTKVMTNRTRTSDRPKSGYIDVHDMQIEIIPYAGTTK